jgi:hypothetical protein
MTGKQTLASVVAQCRQAGWPVEQHDTDSGIGYRVTVPGGKVVDLRGQPTAAQWQAMVDELGVTGLGEARAAWQAQAEAEERTEAERERHDRDRKAVNRAAGHLGVFEPDEAWMITPTRVRETRRILVTPAIARHLLGWNDLNQPQPGKGSNTHNRQFNIDAAQWLRDIILEGDWDCTHQGGASDWNGVIQDGQHRLGAIALAGKTVEILWTVGLDPRLFNKIDTNRLRTGRDTARMRGETNVAALVAAVKVLINHDLFGDQVHLRWRSRRITNDAVNRGLDTYGDGLRHAVVRAQRVRQHRDLKFNWTGLTAAIYLITRRLPEGDPRVETFLRDLETGGNLDPGHDAPPDPVYMLRRYISRMNYDRNRIDAYETVAIIIKTWNLRAKGERRHYIKFSANEPFPKVFLPPPLEPDPVPVEAEAGAGDTEGES